MPRSLTIVVVAALSAAVLALAVALVIDAPSAAVAAPSAARSHAALTDFTVTSAKPVITHVDAGKKGNGIGDYQVFHAALTKDGRTFGVLFGLKLQVAKAGTMGATKGLAVFQNQLTYRFLDGTISVAGVEYFTTEGTSSSSPLDDDATRAVVGGTGAYAGARGTVRTTLQPDGSRKHVFAFLP